MSEQREFQSIYFNLVQNHVLVNSNKEGFSSKEIQFQLGLKCHEPFWTMAHKLRKNIGNRDDRYSLKSMIEIDEGYFTVVPSENRHTTQ